VSRIVDDWGHVVNIVNNYELMSFNFGPTLLSWMEKYAKHAYARILQADKNSIEMYGGHGCAMAQVYNHMIMPLANYQDKVTQTIWGIKDFEHRFGRAPEGIWLAETAIDDETIEVLIDNGIKFTVLSPHQAKAVRKIGEEHWHDVSWGCIDPSMPYRYRRGDKYLDIFFYDGSISKSVAFDCLLHDGRKFAHRLNEGYSPHRHHPQLVNIGTDGESYGHHTKFGDMALAYVLAVKAKELGFAITNYGQFLENHPPFYEVDIKQDSSWSCEHGVGRWKEDCGCSTGAAPGWNQRWRKPLREALDYLRDELIILCKIEGEKYFKDFDVARNAYIELILDRSEKNVERFLKEHTKKALKQDDKVKAVKLLEIQRQAMLMYTSCGWFFAEISGIETIQLMYYAARAMELAGDFTAQDYEKKFLSILQKAKSNVPEYADGKAVYNKFVKKAQVTIEQIVNHWAISSAFANNEGANVELESIYCYKIKKLNYKITTNGSSKLILGRLEITSEITTEKFDRTFALLEYSTGELYCSSKPFTTIWQYRKDKKEIISAFVSSPLVEAIKTLSRSFSERFYTLKDVLIDKRKKILEKVLASKLSKFARRYENFYNDMNPMVSYLMDLGMDTPDVFRLAAKYTITKNIEELLSSGADFTDDDVFSELSLLKAEAAKFHININKTNAGEILARRLRDEILKLAATLDTKVAKNFMRMTEIIEKLSLNLDIRACQNAYFENIFQKMPQLIEQLQNSKNKAAERQLAIALLDVGKKINIQTEFYRTEVDKAGLPR
jgi:alpha-amylase/alpha-mannosidase (GH57 family)